LARRNRLAFAAAGAVAAALIIGLSISTWEYFKERKARQQAMAAEQEKATEAAKAIATSELLQQLLSSAEPDGRRGSDYTVRQLLDDFSGSLTNQLAAQPEVEATVRLTIGWTYHTLGTLSKAETNLQRAFNLRRNALGPQHLDTLDAEYRLAKFLIDTRRWEEGGRLARESWQGRLRILGAEHDDTLGSQQAYAEALSSGGDCLSAERMQLQILQIRERVLGPDDFVTINALRNEGAMLECLGRHSEAEQYLRRAMAGFERTGLTDEADQYFCIKELAMCRLLQGDAAEAEKLLVHVLPRSRQRLGPGHRVTLFVQRVLARALAEEGRLEEAESLCRETLDTLRRTTADQEVHSTARVLLYLGRVLVERGKLEEAEPLLQEALKLFRADEWSKPRSELAGQVENWLGAIQLARKAYPEAEALLLPGSERFFAPDAEMSPHERRLAIGHIVSLHQVCGKLDQAAVLQKKLDGLPK
jgi:tetratricopeptide (TPR) repeat protein